MSTPSRNQTVNSPKLPTPNKTKQEPCKVCKKAILDDQKSSIACDICDSWVHSDIACSRIKKSIFKLITKKDPYVCPVCIRLHKKGKNSLPYEVIKSEYEKTVALAESLLKEKKELEEQLNLRETKLIELNEKLSSCGRSSHSEVKNQNSWAEVTKGRGCRVAAGAVPSPILPTSNSFGVLAEADGEQSQLATDVQNVPKTSPTTSRPRRPVAPVKKFSKFKKSRPRLEIVGDSHARYCGERIRDMGCAGGYGGLARSTVLPGAPMAAVLQSVNGTLAGMKEKDVCVVVGGTNDVTDQSIAMVEDRLVELERAMINAKNLVFVETHYVPTKDKLNEIIRKQNIAISKFCDRNKIAYLNLNSKLGNHCYARDGYHLNRLGKGILCDVIVTYLTSLDVSLPMLPVNRKSVPGATSKEPDRPISASPNASVQAPALEKEIVPVPVAEKNLQLTSESKDT